MRDKIDKFSWAMEFVLGQEGGYSNDPRDPGGETNFGIAKKFHPNVDIKALTAGQAKMIYFGQYWRPARCPDMPAPVALAVMDMAVNCGSAKAAVRLQRAINQIGSAPAPIDVDGDIGDETIGALLHCDPWIVLSVFNGFRLRYYYALRNKMAWAFGGWVGRVAELMVYAATREA